MNRTWKIVVGIVCTVVLLTGLGLLRFGNAVYWASGGERGWSLGATIYQLVGWEAEDYLSDLAPRWAETALTEEEVGETEAGPVYPRHFGHRWSHLGHRFLHRGWGRGLGRHPRLFHPAGGLLRLACLGLVIYGGVSLYRKSRPGDEGKKEKGMEA